MKSNIFREYDIRGIVGEEFTTDDAYYLAKAITTYFIEQSPKITIIALGADGRLHSPEIKAQVVKAITELGIDVLDIGICPTPVMYFSIFNSPATSGLIITASHNPGKYNGIKICLEQKSVWGRQIQEIREICQNRDFSPASTKKGIISEFDAINKYISWLEEHFKHLKNIPIKTLIDCGNGAAGTVIPKLVKTMGWNNAEILCAKVDGNFPNHEADPTTLKNMQCIANKLDKTYDLGLGLDGDCDRMNPITKTGYLVPGDELLALYSKQVLEKNPNATIVFDIKSSLGLIEILRQWGAKDHIAPSGHSLIKDAMLKNNALLAGELSCHFFFKDRYFGYDDGIYAMMRLFEIIHLSKKSLEELLKVFPKKLSSPEIRMACAEEKKFEIVEEVKKYFATRQCKNIMNIDGIRAEMEYGWGLARASNTQAVICLRFESDNIEGLNKIKKDFVEALTPHFNESFLKSEINK